MDSHRIFIEKKAAHRQESESLYREIHDVLQIQSLQHLREVIVYHVFGVDDETLREVAPKVFFEPPRSRMFLTLKELIDAQTQEADDISDAQKTTFGEANDTFSAPSVIAMEFLPGQYDQRAVAAEQCLALFGADQARISTGRMFLLYGNVSKEELSQIKHYYINPIEMREMDYAVPPALPNHVVAEYSEQRVKAFLDLPLQGLKNLRDTLALSMSTEDLECIQRFYREEQRDPTLAEIKILDTYWSDHCRHTTFLTHLTHIDTPPYMHNALDLYRKLREKLNRSARQMTLMEWVK